MAEHDIAPVAAEEAQSVGPVNLDLLAANTAQGIVDDYLGTHGADAGKLDNMATRALAVLQGEGIYAGMLFLYSRSTDTDVAEIIRRHLLEMLVSPALAGLGQKLDTVDLDQWSDVSSFLRRRTGILNDLDKLLLVLDIYEQTLIYTRFGARARDIADRPRQEPGDNDDRAEPAEDGA